MPTSPIPDPADVSRAAAGDAEAFERLYHASAPRVYAMARRILGAEHAEAATQDVYLRAWTRLESFRGESSFATWISRLALNRILDEQRRLARRGAHEVGEISGLDPSAEESAPELALDLAEALERLPEGARTVFLLHESFGLTHDEIAERLALSVGTSKSQLFRARRLLRARLGAAENAS